ncbi:MAG TPA: hypothetical protein PK440_14815 [Candidatus Accumulibacter phosphatis]|nr:hypothetical protein [Candidatus Accumulibacter phosphatis]HRQ96249.1 hypothetical protein [Candidatus Accumulibacter phosphatis]
MAESFLWTLGRQMFALVTKAGGAVAERCQWYANAAAANAAKGLPQISRNSRRLLPGGFAQLVVRYWRKGLHVMRR